MTAGTVIDADGIPSRFAFARNGPMIASDAFQQAHAVAGGQRPACRHWSSGLEPAKAPGL